MIIVSLFMRQSRDWTPLLHLLIDGHLRAPDVDFNALGDADHDRFHPLQTDHADPGQFYRRDDRLATDDPNPLKMLRVHHER